MEARAVAVKMMNEDGGDQVVQRPELVDSDMNMPYKKCRKGSHLRVLGLEHVRVTELLKSVTHGQCDDGPTVTFPP